MTATTRPEPQNNFGDYGDWCPECGTDWKAPHDRECSQFHQCEFPSGCEADAHFHPHLCPEHFVALSALFVPVDEVIIETTYHIKRFRFEGESEVLERGLTLEEAQAHCQREDTHGDGWFDGYEED